MLHRKVYNTFLSPPDLLRKSKRLGLRKSPMTGDKKSSPKAIFLNLTKVKMSDSAANVKEQIRDFNEISLAIDSWDDVFSDFDPSPLEYRVLSEDFLFELRKHYRETPRGSYIVTIYAPAALKDDVSERLVIKRLKQYFKFRHLAALKEVNICVKKGILFVICGVIFLSSLTLIAYYQLAEKLAIELLGIIFMPLGWFGIWEGFSRIIEPTPFLKQDLELFSRLSKTVFKFRYSGTDNTASESKTSHS